MHMHSVFMGHVERLRRLVVGMGLSAEDGDDILQDVYLEVVKRPPEGRSDSEAARWLIRVTVNRCLLEYRRRKRDRRAAKEVLQQWTELEHNAAGPERQAIRAEEIEAIMQCLGEMNESIRMPLAMKTIPASTRTKSVGFWDWSRGRFVNGFTMDGSRWPRH
jgi:RNA polymerase sigma factor (sigma-70 family)